MLCIIEKVKKYVKVFICSRQNMQSGFMRTISSDEEIKATARS